MTDSNELSPSFSLERDLGIVTVERELNTVCLLEQQAGISSGNTCRISGDSNKCPAGSTMTYAGERQTLDADVLCPLDSVQQSEWIEGSQKGLCNCVSQLMDEDCAVIEAEMDCECVACPFGMTVGFAYSCTTEIVGPCKSFDCYGKCNQKYDPGNLVGDKETFPPTILDTPEAGGRGLGPSNHPFVGTAIVALALFRMIF